jgi:hypothetical protein
MSWYHQIGGLQENFRMFYRYFHFIPSMSMCASILSQIFKDATLLFTQGTPNLATVIPTMDHINKILTTSSDSPHQFSLTTHADLAIGKKAMK